MEQRKTPVAYLNCCEAAVVSRVKLCVALLPLLCYERIRFTAAYTHTIKTKFSVRFEVHEFSKCL